MFTGMNGEQIATALGGLVEVLISCVLLQAAGTPTQIGLCALAALCGFTGFALAWED